MNILGFDTSTKSASVALIKDDVLVGEILINDKRTHSQKLMPMLEDLFKLGDISVDDIDVLAVCIGPGSFTGLRIAMSTVKAISHVKNIPIVGVNSLETLANNMAFTDKYIIPILDAQATQVYYGIYKSENGKLRVVEDVGVIDIDDLLEKIEKLYTGAVILGEGTTKYGNKLENKNIYIPSPEKNISKASSVTSLAMQKYKEEKNVYDSYDIVPLYIRKSQAEIQYEERQRKDGI
ncbi:tRNA (adenosine(37)-N6)-threonylcarbamoyltransferase complex dimerization subunit type 1 TsaB [Peptostreptococcus faecalis]|uniref:tRNA (adenosine(37)-N6)-threonylcarbamoyltransferase complex dimerization subunit type 1 TsaB n=1 Tax=Peptostreptococcus faecalis TaxID=2045015 RepID=UPI000C7DE370|nr:tRNA (adenosine(37)-N6)-threonylcarbamoyltransferase complex dimerization subunit type 1 TsaB [Peptostreptococcus faecalis]